jgi:hypothetical protein
MNDKIESSMFSPIETGLTILVLFIFIGLFIEYGKRKHWDKSSSKKQNKN